MTTQELIDCLQKAIEKRPELANIGVMGRSVTPNKYYPLYDFRTRTAVYKSRTEVWIELKFEGGDFQ